MSHKLLPVAKAIQALSKDRSTKVGAVVFDDDMNIRVVGYNGFPRKFDDDPDDRHQRPAKYAYTAHAEENCVAQAARSGVSLKGCSIIVTSLFPCSTCARLIIQSGIKRVYAPTVPVHMGRWVEEGRYATAMLIECGVEVIDYKEN